MPEPPGSHCRHGMTHKKLQERIIVSDGVSSTTAQFIDAFLQSMQLALTPSNRELLQTVIQRYEGPHPIRAAELAGFLAREIST